MADSCLKEKIKSAIKFFKQRHFNFSYNEIFSDTNLTLEKLNDREVNESLKTFLSNIAKENNIRLLFIDRKQKKIRTRTSGPELFIRETEKSFLFHSNCGRLVALPAGCNKLLKPLHNFNDIAQLKLDMKKLKLVNCPLKMDERVLKKLEDKFRVRIEVFEKKKFNDQFKIKKLRASKLKGKEAKALLKFHFDPCSEKLFLIFSPALYFRGFLKRWNRK